MPFDIVRPLRIVKRACLQDAYAESCPRNDDGDYETREQVIQKRRHVLHLPYGVFVMVLRPVVMLLAVHHVLYLLRRPFQHR